jgi:autotransporter-associated beta strand protein
MRSSFRRPLTRITPARLRRLAAAATLAALAPAALGQTWTNTSSANTNWGTAANWSGNSVPTVGAAVNLNVDFTGDQTITLGADRTVRALSAGDTAGPLFTTTFSGNTLIFNGSVFGDATYDQNDSAGAVTIASAVTLASGLTTHVRVGSQTNFSGAVGGTGRLSVNGAGTLTLSGANTYSGDTTINAGTLRVGAGGTSGTLGSGSVTNYAALAFNRSDAFTVANALSGTGSVTQLGTGTTILSGNNSYTGGTALSAGILSLGSANAIGTSGTITFTGGTLQASAANTTDYSARFSSAANQLYRLDTNGQNLTLASALTSSGGSLTKLGDGTLTVTGTNTFTGGTTLSGGTLALGSVGALGSTGTITFTGGTLQASAANTTDYSARFASSPGQQYRIDTNSQNLTLASALTSFGGSLHKLGSGTLTLSGNNTSSGPTTISGGILQIGNGGTSGSLGPGSVTNHAALTFNRSDVLVVSTAISGSGSVSQLGTGTLILSGNNSYTGGTTLSAGTLLLDSTNAIGTSGTLTFTGGTLQSSAINTTDYSARFSSAANQLYRLDTNSQNITLASALTSAGGSLTKLGDGTLTLTGTNTYSGGTTLSGGTLALGSVGAIGTSGPITFTGGTLQASAVNTTDYSARFSSAANQLYRLDTHGQNLTLASALASSGGSLTKLGDGTLTLTGNNSYSGTTTISNGTLQVGAGGTTGKLGSGRVTNNAALTFNRSDDLTVASDISGSGSLTKLGEGTLSLTGNNAYSGTTTISAGTLQLGGGVYLSIGNGSIVNHANLVFNFAGSFNVNNAISGTGNLVVADGVAKLISNNTYSGTTTITTDGALYYGDDGTTGSAGSGAIINHGRLWLKRSDNLTVANTISGTGILYKSGAGRVSLTGANSYSGGTRLNEGTLALDSAGALGSTGTIYFNGGTLQFSAANTTDYSARFDAAASQAYRINTNGQNIVFATALAGFSRGLVKLGGGTLTLSGNNTYSGTTTISAGTLQIGNGGTSGSLGSGAVTNDATLAFNRSDNVTVANTISGSGSLTKLGAGTLTLTGANTYSGTTTIFAGTLQIGNGGTTGSLGSGNVTNNAALSFNRSDAFTVANTISGSGSLTQSGAGTAILTGDNTYSGSTTVSAGTLQVGNGGTGGSLGSGDVTVASGATLALNRSDAVTIANHISGSGSVSQLGSGTLTLTGDNTHSGITTLSGGTLTVGSNTALGTGTVVLIGGTLTTTGGARTLANAVLLEADWTFTGTSPLTFTSPLTLARTRMLTVATGSTLTLAGGITQSDGTRSLLKFGDGTLNLTGASTYTGGTYLGAGITRINNLTGSAFGTGPVTVEAGAALTGAGTFTGILQLNGTVSPGASPGTLSTGSQTWEGGASYLWEINDATGAAGSAFDTLAITGTLSITASTSNPFTVRLASLLPNHSPGLAANFDPAVSRSYSIASTTAGISGFNPSAFVIDRSAFANPLAGGDWSLALANADRDLVLVFTSAIPEPAAAAALAGLAGLVLAATRRRRRLA